MTPSSANPAAIDRHMLSADVAISRNSVAAIVAPSVMPSRRATASIPPAAPARALGADPSSVRLLGDWNRPKPRLHRAILQAIVASDAVDGMKARVLGKRGEGHDAAGWRSQPPAPVRRSRVPDVRDALVDLLALEGEGRRRHTPASLDQLAHAGDAGPDDRRGIVGEDATQKRQVARAIDHRPRSLSDRLLVFGEAVEVAHGGTISPRKFPSTNKSSVSAAEGVPLAVGGATDVIVFGHFLAFKKSEALRSRGVPP